MEPVFLTFDSLIPSPNQNGTFVAQIFDNGAVDASTVNLSFDVHDCFIESITVSLLQMGAR